MTSRSRQRELELEIVATARAWNDGLWGEYQTLRKFEELFAKLDGLGLEVPADGAKPSALAPDTSWDAYRSMRDRISGDADLVLSLIVSTWSKGNVGYTTEQVCLRLNRKHQSISARVNELRDKGWIVDSTMRRKTTSGRDAVVWMPSAVVRTMT